MNWARMRMKEREPNTLSSNMYRNQLEQLQKEKAKLEGDLAAERTHLAKFQKEASGLQTDIAKTKSESTRKSKQRQLLSKQIGRAS